MTTLKDDLIAAKALIADPKKWSQGIPHPGTLCAIDACEVVEFGNHHVLRSRTEIRAYHALKQALPPGRYKDSGYVGGYNDDPTTTHADIMALFDRAIANA